MKIYGSGRFGKPFGMPWPNGHRDIIAPGKHAVRDARLAPGEESKPLTSFIKIANIFIARPFQHGGSLQA
jgi:hypothetical protein